MITASWTIISWLCHLIGILLHISSALSRYFGAFFPCDLHSPERIKDSLSLLRDALPFIPLFVLQLLDALLFALLHALDIYQSDRWLGINKASFTALFTVGHGRDLE